MFGREEFEEAHRRALAGDERRRRREGNKRVHFLTTREQIG
jgi:hypothetical protein